MPAVQHRDAYLGWAGRQRLIIATDNAANIGPAAADQLAVDPYLVGYLTARVAALEAVTLGATALAVSSTLSYDYQNQYGQQITAGVLAVLAELGLPTTALTGSCETNFPAEVTCLGVTVIALAEPETLLLNQVKAGDGCYLVGTPRVGVAVLQAYRQLPSMQQVQELASWPETSEVIPVGSRGVAHELEQLARVYGRQFRPCLPHDWGWQQSAGPATCLLAIGAPGLEGRLRAGAEPIMLLGYLE